MARVGKLHSVKTQAHTRTHTHTHTHTSILTHAYPSTFAHIHTHTHERARGLGVSQRAPLIRVPASRSHNLRPTSPPACPVGPVAPAPPPVYIMMHLHTRARALTGCTRRQIITLVCFTLRRTYTPIAYGFRNVF